jgi:hypothetical protein
MCLYLPEVILTLEPTLESFRRRSRLTAPSGRNRLRRSSAAGTRTSAPDRTRIQSEAVDRHRGTESADRSPERAFPRGCAARRNAPGEAVSAADMSIKRG